MSTLIKKHQFVVEQVAEAQPAEPEPVNEGWEAGSGSP